MPADGVADATSHAPPPWLRSTIRADAGQWATFTLLPECIDRVQRYIDRGEFLEAYDNAVEAIGVHPDAVQLQYLAVLALARSGAMERALEVFERFGLGHARLDGRLAEDVPALEARIFKDRALGAEGGARAVRAVMAAERYESIYRTVHGVYTGVNAATMWLVAGDGTKSRKLAREALDICRRDIDSGDDSYWTAATEAEAALLLDDIDIARAAIGRANAVSSGQYAARASTRRQLSLICEIKGIDLALLDGLANPAVIHYAGHRIGQPGQPARFPADQEARVRSEIDAQLEELKAGFAYGSLASGADILVAEATLERNAELHVILPFQQDEFVAASVADAGPGWVQRFERCLKGATSVSYSTDGDYLGDPLLFDFCARVAMGDAIMRASAMESEVHQLAVWDGRPSETSAGTGVDIERWKSLGRNSVVIDSASSIEGSSRETPPKQPRVTRAMLFADIAGFSRLNDAQIPRFMDDVMGPIAETIELFGDDVLLRHTWGDGLYLVFTGVEPAAMCALSLQDTMRTIDLARLGLSQLRGMRIGGHAGPVFEGWDRVRRERNFFGASVTRAARIEPRTPEGEVYVTHPFAALTALEASELFSCEYVGHVPTAKDYGILPMFVLKRRQ